MSEVVRKVQDMSFSQPACWAEHPGVSCSRITAGGYCPPGICYCGSCPWASPSRKLAARGRDLSLAADSTARVGAGPIIPVWITNAVEFQRRNQQYRKGVKEESRRGGFRAEVAFALDMGDRQYLRADGKDGFEWEFSPEHPQGVKIGPAVGHRVDRGNFEMKAAWKEHRGRTTLNVGSLLKCLESDAIIVYYYEDNRDREIPYAGHVRASVLADFCRTNYKIIINPSDRSHFYRIYLPEIPLTKDLGALRKLYWEDEQKVRG